MAMVSLGWMAEESHRYVMRNQTGTTRTRLVNRTWVEPRVSTTFL